MKTEYFFNNKNYILSNEDLEKGDKVFSISKGKIINGLYIHEKFDFRDFVSGFPNNPHTILDLKYSDYKPYETRTDKGLSPIESYFKIINLEGYKDESTK